MLIHRLVLIATAAILSFATAHAETRERLRDNLQQFEQFAGAPVEEMRNFRLYRWRPLGQTQLAVWSSPNRIFLVDVDTSCSGLDFAKTIAISSNSRVVMRRTDHISFDRQRCRIESIRPVDYKALRAAGKTTP